VTGPLFGFSETWQLVINTGTTIVTFLMVFLIQNTQNRDALAVHLKLDELINAMESADDTLMLAEDETVEELEALKQKYEALSRQHDALTSELRQKKSGRATPASTGS
jgi:low affinity Fe/Cu permease